MTCLELHIGSQFTASTHAQANLASVIFVVAVKLQSKIVILKTRFYQMTEKFASGKTIGIVKIAYSLSPRELYNIATS